MRMIGFVGLALFGGSLRAQTPTPTPPPPLPPAEQQIAAAVSALPAEHRAGATVMGYDAAGKLVTLRTGTGDMICLGHNPRDKDFHVACYHRSMDPFMARGRELRASGVTGEQVDSVRFREIRQSKLVMPKQPAAMYQFFGGTFDPATSQVTGAQVLYVVYIPFATAKTTGLSEKPSRSDPWIMFPGTPKAHIMFTGSMTRKGIATVQGTYWWRKTEPVRCYSVRTTSFEIAAVSASPATPKRSL